MIARTAPARRGVLLDRDGVLVDTAVVDGTPHPIASADDLRVLPGVDEACARLREAGWVLVCVTNQPDIARGSVTREAVDAVNARLQSRLRLDGVVVCPHDDADGCECRKPLPGMLVASGAAWSLDLAESVMVGDRWKDVEAGRRAGCRTVFIDRGYAERAPLDADHVCSSLIEAVPWILSRAIPASDPRRVVHV